MTYTDEDVERVALKICEALGDWNPVPMNKMAYEDAARAALSAMPRHVPEGWVIVPRILTHEMAAALEGGTSQAPDELAKYWVVSQFEFFRGKSRGTPNSFPAVPMNDRE